MRRRSTDIIRGLTALALLVGLLVGVPWALVTQVGSPLPSAAPSWEQFSRALTRGDLDDWTIIKALAVLVWLAWAQVAANVIAEAAAVARCRPALRIPGAAPFRSLATNLVASVAVLVSTLGRPSVVSDEPVPQLHVVLASATPGEASIADTASVEEPFLRGQHMLRVDDDGQTGAGAGPRWTVRHRDTLWDIAEQALGDGLRWREVHRLNAGRIQSDGGTLGDDGDIRPGWTLILPADAAATGEEATPCSSAESGADEDAATVVVGPGDTLWALSGEHLGDPLLWPELYEENRGRPQPDGRALADPDLIQPGWVLEVPGQGDVAPHDWATDDLDVEEGVASSGDRPAASTSAPPERPPRVQAPGDVRATPPRLEPGQEPGGGELMSGELREDEVAERVTPVAGAALAAAGAAATLDRIRRSRRRRRRPGERIRLPEGEAASTELRIRGLADPADVDRIDAALRSMAAERRASGLALPPVVLVSVSSRELALHLAKPEEKPPDGWIMEDGGLTWVLRTSAELPTAEAEGHVESPAPLLVTLGTTAEGQRRVMLNLAHVGRLSLQAPVEVRRRLLLHMAMELATTGRALTLEVLVHGFGGSLSTLERIRFCAETEELADCLASAASESQGRGIISTVGLTTESVDLSAEVTLGGSVALVSGEKAAANWALREQGGALHLAPAGLVLQPLELTPDELEVIGELVLQAKKAPTSAAFDDDVEPDHPGDVHEGPSDEVIDLAGELDDEGEKPIEVKILGAVEVKGAVDLTSSKAEELIVYLATHRKGTTADQLQEALWPDEEPSPGRLHTTVWRARQSLGDGRDGDPLLPKLDRGRYALSSDVGLDYERFRAHVSRARVAPSSAIDELHAALALVRGEPYSGTAGEYIWSSYEVHAIAQSIGDAAHWLAQLYLDADQPAEARWAAEQGLRADPYLEALYRDLMEAAAAEANLAEVEIVMKRLRALVADDADDNDADDRLDPETLRCYDTLTSIAGRRDRAV